MSEHSKITASHRCRAAVIYVRQSTLAQLERNTESTARQYDLVERAAALGWPRDTIRVVDADLGVSGSALGQREGFESLVAEVALGQVGIILALEVSRLARDNTAWYRLLDLAGACDTLVADADGVYHPGLFNDRLVLGMKGIMSEAELHVLRARLTGGIRNKAARGQLRTGLPVGLVWGETDGQIRLHPDEAVTGVIAAVFDRFTVCGSVRATWLWLREQGLRWPLQTAGYLRGRPSEITWVEPTYHAVHTTLTHPGYAGTYVFGRTRQHRYLGRDGQMRARQRRLPREQWEVLITEHHPGFIDWDTYQANQARIGTNIRPQAREPGTGAVREGCALLQGLATCGSCGRKLAVFYRGPAKSTPGYYCQGSAELVDGRGARHMNVGGQAIDAAVAEAFLAALQPTALQACLAAAQQLEAGHDAALAQHRRQVEQARYHAGAGRAPLPGRRPGQPAGRPRPGNRVEHRAAAAGRRRGRAGPPRGRAPENPHRPGESHRSWPSATTSTACGRAPTTTDKDRKQLLHTLLEEVNITLAATRPDPARRAGAALERRRDQRAHRAAAATANPRSAPTRTPSTCSAGSPCTTPTRSIAGILNRQHRRTARGLSYTASRVQSLRHHWKIPCHQPGDQPREGELLNVTAAAKQLGIAPSTLLRWLNDGFIAGEQITPGAPGASASPTNCATCSSTTPPTAGSPCSYATRALGVSRQTVLQRVKRGELHAVLTRTGRRKGLRIELPTPENSLF